MKFENESVTFSFTEKDQIEFRRDSKIENGTIVELNQVHPSSWEFWEKIEIAEGPRKVSFA